jgi:predicted DsbA family dithiol-disulfide isomerase
MRHEKHTHEKHKHKHHTKHRPRKKGLSGSEKAAYIIGGIVVVAIVIFIFVKLNSDKAPAPSSSPGSIEVKNPEQYGTVDMTFHVMSQCPYGTQVEDAIAPVLEELGDNINFRLEYIGAETADGFSSLHGQPEVEGDIIQLCVQDLYPEELMTFVVCQNKNPSDLKGSVGKCAEEASINAEKINECAEGEKGKELMSESIKKSQEAQAQGSPTIYINNVLYSGARDSDSFKRSVCSALEGHPVCEGLPACSSDFDCRDTPGKIGLCENPGEEDAKCTYQDDEAITLTIVNAKECTSCDTTQLVTVLSQVFLNMEVEEVDASSSEGASLITDLGLQKAPSYVFSGNLEKTYSWQNNARLRGAFNKKDDYFVMVDEASGATYVLDAKKRKEMEELTGVKKGDNRPQIDFYVMSYCPYGNIAEEAIEPAYQLLKDSAEFNPHYVIYSNYQGGGPKYCLDEDDKYCSMHGVQELNQGLRELCVAKHLGMDAYFEFTLEMNDKCNSGNADTCWEDVAESLNLDTETISKCESDEAEEMLSKELALNTALGVRGSPTVFVEGEPYSGARSAAGYAQSLCASFETAPDECGTESLGSLGEAAPAPTAAAAAGGCG